MSELQIFNYGQKNIRTVTKDNEIWFVAKDVCEILDVHNPSQALSRLDDDEKNTIILNEGIGNPEKAIVSEAGLYSLTMGSKKPEAKPFKRWVTHEVLPSIRQHGAYMTTETIEKVLSNPDTIINIATQLKTAQGKIQALEVAREQDRPKVVFADSVSVSNTSILIGELAKILCQNGTQIGQNRLFDWMRENGYLIRRKGTDYNMPTQYSIELGLFEIKETTITHADGHATISKTTKVTGKGQIYFVNKFNDIRNRKDIV